MDQEFISRAEKTSVFSITSQDVASLNYKNEIRYILNKHWFPDLEHNKIFTESTNFHDLNKSIQLLKLYDPGAFELLYSYNLKGLGPGEIMLYYILNKGMLGGGSSAGIDLIVGDKDYEVKAVRPIKNRVLEGQFMNDFKLGGTCDLSNIISDLKAIGNVNKTELPGSRINKLRNNKYFKLIEEEYREIAGEYFSEHDVIFMNNSKTNRGEIIQMNKVHPENIFIERMTSGTVKPLIKIG